MTLNWEKANIDRKPKMSVKDEIEFVDRDRASPGYNGRNKRRGVKSGEPRGNARPTI